MRSSYETGKALPDSSLFTVRGALSSGPVSPEEQGGTAPNAFGTGQSVPVNRFATSESMAKLTDQDSTAAGSLRMRLENACRLA